MEKRHLTKFISLTLAVSLAAPLASCASHKREYKTIKEDDKWYSCDSFEVSDLYPSDIYDYADFRTVGATEESVYVFVDSMRKIEGSTADMDDKEYLKYYEQSILRFSYDGELLDKEDFAVMTEEGYYRILEKAWVSDGTINTLEQIYDSERGEVVSSLLNNEPFDIPDVRNFNNSVILLQDMYTVNGYTFYILRNSSIIRNQYAIKNPDGTSYEVDLNEITKNGDIDNVSRIIPGPGNTVILPAFSYTYEIFFISLDLATGKAEELEGLYGSYAYWIEHASGKTVARDFKGFSFVDNQTGELTPICEYCDIDASMSTIVESELLYISDDGSEMVLGVETYDSVGNTTWKFGYKVMHLSLEDVNPHAGKTVLTLSNGDESTASESDLYAVNLFNNSNSSFFIKYVFPVNDKGEYTDVQADIALTESFEASAADSNKYIDLAPFVGSGDDLFQNAIDAAKQGNSIYHIPLDIASSGIVTVSSNVPDGQTGFTFEQYIKFVDDVCNGTDPMSRTFGFRMGKTQYFTKLFVNSSDLFISDGKIDIDNESFRQLMIFVDTYGSPETKTIEELIEENNLAVVEATSAVKDQHAGLENKLDAKYGDLYSFDSYIESYAEFGEGIGIYGLPSFDGRGPQTTSYEFVSVSSESLYPEACAEFVNLLISYEVQITKYDRNPVNKKALADLAETKLSAYNEYVEKEDSPELRTIPHEAIDRYIAILSSSYGGMSVGSDIESIINEEASAYFTGSRALDDVIPVMQNRIQTVLNETA